MHSLHKFLTQETNELITTYVNPNPNGYLYTEIEVDDKEYNLIFSKDLRTKKPYIIIKSPETSTTYYCRHVDLLWLKTGKIHEISAYETPRPLGWATYSIQVYDDIKINGLFISRKNEENKQVFIRYDASV